MSNDDSANNPTPEPSVTSFAPTNHTTGDLPLDPTIDGPIDTPSNTPSEPEADVNADARLEDYLQESLAKPDPLEANVGVMNADLMFFANALQATICESLRQPAESLQGMDEFRPAVGNYVKLSKQVATMTQIALKLEARNGSC